MKAGRIASLALLLLMSSPGWAGSIIQDNAKLFKEEDVLAEVEARSSLRQKYGHDLFIETIDKLEGNSWQEWLPSAYTRHRLDRYASKKIPEREEESSFDSGIYVLICQEPPGVNVRTWPDQDPDWFPRRAQNLLSTRLSRTLKEQGPSGALLHELLVDLQRQLEPPPPPPVSPDVLLIIVASCLGAWILLVILSRRWRESEELWPAGHVTDLRAAWLGGLFGTPAAFWVYDRLFQRSAPRSPSASEHDLFAPEPQKDHPGPPAPAPSPSDFPTGDWAGDTPGSPPTDAPGP
jgi:hypothetical protein